MSKAVENLQKAQKRAMAGRPKVGGFPYLAETLRHELADYMIALWASFKESARDTPACCHRRVQKADGRRHSYRNSDVIMYVTKIDQLTS
jgi:uncharacterized protein YbcV (DUF1398 family)